MAIDKLTSLTPTVPIVNGDWPALLAQLLAAGQNISGRLIVQGSTIKAGTYIMIGAVWYKATTDTAITGTPSAYVKITPSGGGGATASAAFVASLSGVTWNDAYGGYYDGGAPDSLYVFDEDVALSIGQVTGVPKTPSGISAPPVGAVAIWSVSTMPGGWLECAGQAVSRITYARLFAIIATTYGVGDGTTTFNVPDLRSATVRGVGTPTRFSDSTAVTLNQTIDDKMQTHTHTTPYYTNTFGSSQVVAYSAFNGNAQTLTGNNSGRSGNETTGKAVGMYYMIKT